MKKGRRVATLTRVVLDSLLSADLSRLGDFHQASDLNHVCTFSTEHGDGDPLGRKAVWRPHLNVSKGEVFFGDVICVVCPPERTLPSMSCAAGQVALPLSPSRYAFFPDYAATQQRSSARRQRPQTIVGVIVDESPRCYCMHACAGEHAPCLVWLAKPLKFCNFSVCSLIELKISMIGPYNCLQ